jgi:predicted P-loop ATPase
MYGNRSATEPPPRPPSAHPDDHQADPATNGKPRYAAAGWARHAEALADWALSRLVVRKDVYGGYTADGGTYTAHEPVTRELLIRHFRGEITIGLRTTSTDCRCLCTTGDVDAHDDLADAGVNWRCAELAAEVIREFDLTPLIIDSNGKGGYHVKAFFKKPVSSVVAKWLGEIINARFKAASLPEIEFFPKQETLTIDKPYGNWARVPGGRRHKRPHWTRIWDPLRGAWLEGEAAALALLRVAGDMPTELLKRFKERPKDPKPKEPKPTRNAAPHAEKDEASEARVRAVLAHYSNSGVHYDSWLAVGMALNDWDQSRGLDLWLEWSAKSPKHDDATTRDKFASFSPGGGITIATLFKSAMEHGWKPQAAKGGDTEPHQSEPLIRNEKKRPVSCLHNTVLWLERESRVIQLDTFNKLITIDAEQPTDASYIGIQQRIEADLRVGWGREHVRNAVELIASRNSYNPLTYWLDRLVWDKVPRIASFFTDTFNVPPTGSPSSLQAYVRYVSSSFFISTVARAYRPGCKVDTMPVLIGDQGILKSSLFRALVPDEAWFTDDIGDLFENKAGEGLRGKRIIEFSEFARINRATNDVVKGFLTRQMDHYRPPYGRVSLDFPRTCVFVGTTNNRQPLQDDENRRDHPLTCGEPENPVRYVTENREQLWAEAVHRFRAGEKWWADDVEVREEAKRAQEDTRAADIWEDVLREQLKGKNTVTMQQAADALRITPDRYDRSMQTRLGSILKRIGFPRSHHRGTKTETKCGHGIASDAERTLS